MNRHGHFGPAVWPYFIAVACLLLVVGCQDGAGPNLVTSPEGKPDYDAVKPPPPPPPPPAAPAIAFKTEARVRSKFYDYLKVMNADGTNITTILTSEHSTQGVIFGYCWSPGGNTIAFNWSEALWLIDVSVVNGVPTGSNTRLLVPATAGRYIEGLDWAPSGDQIVLAFDTQLGKPGSLEVVSVSGGAPVQVYYSETGVFAPRWSPEARRIAFFENIDDISVRVLNLDDGSVTTVLDEEPQSMSWARTQDVLAITTDGIYTYQLPSGPRTFICAGQSADWSPDDRELVYAIPWNGIWKVNVATGVTTRLASINDVVYPVWKR